MGELHLEVLIERLKREFKVEVNEGEPQVSYKEQISTPVEHRETYKKQSGGRGKFADIVVKISPQDDEEKTRSEEHTSELQSRPHLVCRLLLEKKKNNIKNG